MLLVECADNAILNHRENTFPALLSERKIIISSRINQQNSSTSLFVG